MFNFKIKMDIHNYVLLYSLIILSFFNKQFFINILDYKNIFLYKFFLSLIAFKILILFFSLIFYKKTTKILSCIILILNSFVLYFMDSLNIQIDENIITNLFETNYKEAIEFVQINLFLYVIFYGILPSFFVIKFIKINYDKKNRYLLSVITLILILIHIPLSLYNQNYLNFLKKNKKSINYLLPANYIKGIIDYIDTLYEVKFNNKNIISISDDINVKQNFNINNTNNKQNLVVFVLGESARADNFSLNEYKRKTNPLLENQNIINFKNTYSCATSTFLSVPCIFSHMERKNFSISKAKNTENILDIFKKLYFNIIWLSNNGGCKGVCDRVIFKEINSPNSNDSYLFEKMKNEVNNIDNNINNRNNIIILHQRGSHGPLYYQRYPKEFEIFTPICKSSLENCKNEEIVNAYDNTILYNDYLLNDAIEWLKTKADKFNIMLLFISDHGESLGEKNSYMHGLPYSIAGKSQTHIPFFIWLSDSFVENFNIDIEFIKNKSHIYTSHDNIFHSLLGVFNIDSKYYNKQLDLFN